MSGVCVVACMPMPIEDGVEGRDGAGSWARQCVMVNGECSAHHRRDSHATSAHDAIDSSSASDLGLLAGAALTASSAQAASGPGPFYAEPAWDQKLACPTKANCPRFLVLTNWNSEAVLDKETGLVWERSPALTTSHME